MEPSQRTRPEARRNDPGCLNTTPTRATLDRDRVGIDRKGDAMRTTKVAKVTGLVLAAAIAGYLVGPPLAQAAASLVTIKDPKTAQKVRVTAGNLWTDASGSLVYTADAGNTVIVSGAGNATKSGTGVISGISFDVPNTNNALATLTIHKGASPLRSHHLAGHDLRRERPPGGVAQPVGLREVGLQRRAQRRCRRDRRAVRDLRGGLRRGLHLGHPLLEARRLNRSTSRDASQACRRAGCVARGSWLRPDSWSPPSRPRAARRRRPSPPRAVPWCRSHRAAARAST